MSRAAPFLTYAQRGFAAWKRGLWAEGLCALYLRLHGWRILAARYRTPVGEIDLVARRGSVLAIIEVKARPTAEAALQAIKKAQKDRLIRAAGLFLGRHPALAPLDLRFDAMMVTPWHWPQHLPDAWRTKPYT